MVHEGDVRCLQIQSRRDLTILKSPLTCTQQCSNIEVRSHTSFVKRTFPNFSYAFSLFPFADPMQKHSQLRSIFIHIALLSALWWQRPGEASTAAKLCNSCSPEHAGFLCTALATWASKSATAHSLASAQASPSVCSDYCHLSYVIFLKKNKFQGFLWRSFESYTFPVVAIFHLFGILRAKSSIEAAFSFTSMSLAVWELRGGSCRIFPSFSSVLSPQACVFG